MGARSLARSWTCPAVVYFRGGGGEIGISFDFSSCQAPTGWPTDSDRCHVSPQSGSAGCTKDLDKAIYIPCQSLWPPAGVHGHSRTASDAELSGPERTNGHGIYEHGWAFDDR